jgi:hypothetical protein
LFLIRLNRLRTDHHPYQNLCLPVICGFAQAHGLKMKVLNSAIGISYLVWMPFLPNQEKSAQSFGDTRSI